MKKIVLLCLLSASAVHLPSAQGTVRPVHTYSIVAFDRASGEFGAAVQSHWFSVGSLVPWVESEVGAVVTQSFVEPSYGPLGLALLRSGKSAEDALAGLVKADRNESVRQVAMVDARGKAAAHTGTGCISEAGHFVGDGFSCQANMMLKNTVWEAMARAYKDAPGELADRLVAALEAAEREGGDVRGRQSAAIIVVKGKSSGVWWKDRIYDLRVEDDPDPVAELKRLLRLNKAYNRMNRGDELMTGNRIAEAVSEYSAAMDMFPENAEMIFWPAVTLASSGRVEESLPLFQKVFSLDKNWAVLLARLPAVGQFPKDKALMKKVLSLAAPKK